MDFLPLFLFLMLTMSSLQSLEEAQAVHAFYMPTRCRCIKHFRNIHRKHIEDFEVTLPNSACQFPEVVLLLKNTNESCLDHSKKQAKKLIHCWKKHQENKKGRMKCMRKRSKKNNTLSKQKRRKLLIT